MSQKFTQRQANIFLKAQQLGYQIDFDNSIIEELLLAESAIFNAIDPAEIEYEKCQLRLDGDGGYEYNDRMGFQVEVTGEVWYQHRYVIDANGDRKVWLMHDTVLDTNANVIRLYHERDAEDAEVRTKEFQQI